MFINHLIHFTPINKQFIAATTQLWTLLAVSEDVSSAKPAQQYLQYTQSTATRTLSTTCTLTCLQITDDTEGVI
jgi:hypothetical protein